MTAESPISPGQKVRFEKLEEDAVWKVTLDWPKGNILDAAMIAELEAIFAAAGHATELKAVILAAAGPDFSYGASVEEHRCAQAAGMLARFHELLRTIAVARVPVVAAVRGRCLGGGLELVAFCHRVVATREALLGFPEVKLGVFAPAASVILGERLGRGRVDDLLLTGRVVEGGEAAAIALIDELADDPERQALAWITEHLLPLSASSLRFAVQAARQGFMRRFEQEIGDIERLYLDQLMTTPDANEGIAAFLAKRPPPWRRG